MECPVCYESFSKTAAIPKILNKCGHTICQPCLNNYANASSACHIKCPFCKVEYSKNEISTSPTNFYILNMLNEKEQTVSKKSPKQLARTCSAHATTQMDFFCKTDKSYLCGKCLISGEHLGHDIVHVDDEVNVYRREIVNSIKSLDEKFSMISDNKEKFEKSLSEYQQLTKDTLIDLDHRFNEILNLVAKRREELIENFMQSTSSINEYLKDKVQYFGKVQENIKHCIRQQKDKKKKLDNLNGLDLRSLEPLNEEEVMKKVYENLNEKFNHFGGGAQERDLNQVLDFLASVQLNFSQSPFFVFKENLLNDFLENYAQIVSFNFGLQNEFQIENTLVLENKEAAHLKKNNEDHGWAYVKDFQKPASIQVEPLNLENKENIPEQQPNLITVDSMKIEEPEVEIGVQDPFLDFRTSGITLCLTGQNNKVLLMNEKGESELTTLEFEFSRPDDSKAIVFKNFASCTTIERNKVIYTGGGPSNEAFLVEFKSKKKAHVTCLPKMNFKRCWHGIVYVRPYVYVIGGYDGGSRLRECERLNLQDNTQGASFEAIAPLNEARSLFGYTMTKNNVIYVVGGVTASKKFGCTDSIERYSILENKWSLLQIRLPQKLCGLSCLTFEDENQNEEKMIIFGGSDSLNRSVKSVFELNLTQGKINEFDQMMSKRQMNNKAFEKHGIIYLLGGGTDNDCEVWNFNNNSKTTFNYGDHLKSDLKNFCAFTA